MADEREIEAAWGALTGKASLNRVLINKADLRAALAAAEQARWRPIETAPKGETVLVEISAIYTDGHWFVEFDNDGDPLPRRWRQQPAPPEENS